MTQVSGKVQTQPDGGDSKQSGEASRQARATKGSGNGSRRQAPSPRASTAQEGGGSDATSERLKGSERRAAGESNCKERQPVGKGNHVVTIKKRAYSD
ncbi:MAG: hypothetical protein JRF30_08030 [Deltaproteobacteria bacterium]|nr:hypothetical protein [Deltaproteobacteria bacterium]MBW1794125.1 hypothetical protein [Deltaproteobacteria bacterium]MBW2330863.1 hypothetical protein [Deltaproteobacteria bacterium]